MLVGQHPMKSLLPLLSSVSPLLSFLKIASLVFSDNIHGSS